MRNITAVGNAKKKLSCAGLPSLPRWLVEPLWWLSGLRDLSNIEKSLLVKSVLNLPFRHLP